jgi:hypothetical protein
VFHHAGTINPSSLQRGGGAAGYLPDALGPPHTNHTNHSVAGSGGRCSDAKASEPASRPLPDGRSDVYIEPPCHYLLAGRLAAVGRRPAVHSLQPTNRLTGGRPTRPAPRRLPPAPHSSTHQPGGSLTTGSRPVAAPPHRPAGIGPAHHPRALTHLAAPLLLRLTPPTDTRGSTDRRLTTADRLTHRLPAELAAHRIRHG